MAARGRRNTACRTTTPMAVTPRTIRPTLIRSAPSGKKRRAAEAALFCNALLLLSGQGVAVVADVVVGGLHVGLLRGQKLTDGERQVVLERLFVGVLGDVLALLGGGEQLVIAAGAKVRFEVAPHTMHG